jgi:tetratricopeptide (TPR) repeat protein
MIETDTAKKKDLYIRLSERVFLILVIIVMIVVFYNNPLYWNKERLTQKLQQVPLIYAEQMLNVQAHYEMHMEGKCASLVLLSSIYKARGENEKALEVCNRILTTANFFYDRAEAYFLMAAIYQEEKKWDEAISILEKVVVKCSQEDSALRERAQQMLADCYREKNDSMNKEK